MSAIIVIPSRLDSTRLPRKPLALIQAKEMILHVLDQAKKTGIKNIIDYARLKTSGRHRSIPEPFLLEIFSNTIYQRNK